MSRNSFSPDELPDHGPTRTRTLGPGLATTVFVVLFALAFLVVRFVIVGVEWLSPATR